jgi:RND family efflux transporter MFP subunit
MTHRNLIRSLAVVLALALVAGGAANAADEKKEKKKKEKSTRIFVEEIVKSNVTETVPVLGRFVAKQYGQIAARTGGAVAEILTDVGDRVKKGDVLVRLDTSRLGVTRSLREAELKESVGGLNAARAQLNLVNQELERQARLKGSAAFSKARYIDKQAEAARYQAEVAEKEAAVTSAEANLRMAEIDLAYAEIKAPYDGVVVERHVSLGNFVNIGNQVVTLLDDRSLEVEADIPQSRLGGVSPGRGVEIRFGNDITRTAKVRAIIPNEDGRTRTRAVRFVPELNGVAKSVSFAANQSVTVAVPISEAREMVTVHKDAVISSGNSYFVFLIKEKKAYRRDIKIGQAVGSRFVVLAGLSPGDIVATHGNERLKTGAKVQIRKR